MSVEEALRKLQALAAVIEHNMGQPHVAKVMRHYLQEISKQQ